MWKGRDDGTGGLLYVVFGIAVVITFVWVIATLVAVVFPSHPVSTAVNATMGSAVTAAFALAGILASRRGGDGEGK